jgi:hypothetical protein
MSNNMMLNFLSRYVTIILLHINYKVDSRLRFGGVSPGAAAILTLFYALGTIELIYIQLNTIKSTTESIYAFISHKYPIDNIVDKLNLKIHRNNNNQEKKRKRNESESIEDSKENPNKKSKRITEEYDEEQDNIIIELDIDEINKDDEKRQLVVTSEDGKSYEEWLKFVLTNITNDIDMEIFRISANKKKVFFTCKSEEIANLCIQNFNINNHTIQKYDSELTKKPGVILFTDKYSKDDIIKKFQEKNIIVKPEHIIINKNKGGTGTTIITNLTQNQATEIVKSKRFAITDENLVEVDYFLPNSSLLLKIYGFMGVNNITPKIVRTILNNAKIYPSVIIVPNNRSTGASLRFAICKFEDKEKFDEALNKNIYTNKNKTVFLKLEKFRRRNGNSKDKNGNKKHHKF